MPKFFTTLLFVASLAGTYHANAASFDCDKASSDLEQVICDDRELSSLDSEMDILYRIALESDKNTVRDAQRRWLWKLRRIDAQKYERAIYLSKIYDSYQVRIEELKGIVSKMRWMPIKVDGEFLNNACFPAEWLSSDNYKALSLFYGIPLKTVRNDMWNVYQTRPSLPPRKLNEEYDGGVYGDLSMCQRAPRNPDVLVDQYVAKSLNCEALKVPEGSKCLEIRLVKVTDIGGSIGATATVGYYALVRRKEKKYVLWLGERPGLPRGGRQ
jgi:uncharacterized protein